MNREQHWLCCSSDDIKSSPSACTYPKTRWARVCILNICNLQTFQADALSRCARWTAGWGEKKNWRKSGRKQGRRWIISRVKKEKIVSYFSRKLQGPSPSMLVPTRLTSMTFSRNGNPLVMIQTRFWIWCLKAVSGPLCSAAAIVCLARSFFFKDRLMRSKYSLNKVNVAFIRGEEALPWRP